MFKVGDKVRCIRKINPDCRLEIGKVYTILYIDDYDEDSCCELEELDNGSVWTIDQFELAKISNEERIRRRKEELCLK